LPGHSSDHPDELNRRLKEAGRAGAGVQFAEEAAMPRAMRTGANILIASDSSSDAALVQSILEREFDTVHVSTDPDRSVSDFELHPPGVLILAFDSLEKSERYYLGLFRHSQMIHRQPHRTVILCAKDQIQAAFELCRREVFDDYNLFWPMTNDALQLPMSVHRALRALAALDRAEPTAAEFAGRARHLAQATASVTQRIAEGGARINEVGDSVARIERGVDAALDGFSRRITQGELPDVLAVRSVEGLEREIDRIKRAEIHPGFRAVADSIEPLTKWARELQRDHQPQLDAVRSLKAMADHVVPTVLVVDDDDFQHQLVANILKAENYRLMFAAGGVEALRIVRKAQPDLILMDFAMPTMDGMEVMRRLKAVPAFALVPVIMVTGNSGGHVVKDSLKSGAIDFVVKPFDRETLIAKVARVLRATV
jgi:CheY-like chemotaxis protein